MLFGNEVPITASLCFGPNGSKADKLTTYLSDGYEFVRLILGNMKLVQFSPHFIFGNACAWSFRSLSIGKV